MSKPIIRIVPNNQVFDDPALFKRAYNWMKARGLSEGRSEHAALVVR
jgi:hypothetical protein